MVSSEERSLRGGTICVIQARMGSTRLPGKVLAELAGRPMLRFMLDRLSPLEVDRVVVATSTLERDDPVAEVARSAGAEVVRGPEADVLERYRLALDQYPATTVIRLTADCPLSDPTLVGAVLALHHTRQAAYTCNVLPRTFPKGLDVEVMSAEALLTAAAEATETEEREHVTPFLYRHPERFRLANLRSGDDLGDENWTVDTPEDLQNVRQIVTLLGYDSRFEWRDVLAHIGRQFTPIPGAVHLRPATLADGDDLLAWRNDPESVRYSIAGNTIDEVDHRRWLLDRIDDPGTRIWIAQVDDRAIGYVRLEVANTAGLVSIAVAPERRGEGWGTALLRAMQQRLKGDLQVTRVDAEVTHDNLASERTFLAAGFTSDRDVNGVHHFVWNNATP